MTARMRRLTSDYEQIKKDFSGHQSIIVTPVGPEPPEKYHITYFVNGIYLLPDGRIQTLGRHEVEITLHAEYPRYKPICKIMTPIWHPNFKDGQICIGDIWGAGESLSDIIVNIGDMIQYKSWNSYSPLSAEAAKWAIENKHLFPIGTLDLYKADYSTVKKSEVAIDLLDESEVADMDNATAVLSELPPVTPPSGSPVSGFGADSTVVEDSPATDVLYSQTSTENYPGASSPFSSNNPNGNDFDITAEELAGIVFVPSAQRMQTVAHGGTVQSKKLNFKTVLVKGMIWALIGAILGFCVSELADRSIISDASVATIMGHTNMADYFRYTEQADRTLNKLVKRFKTYCRQNNLDPDAEDSSTIWRNNLSVEDQVLADEYNDLSSKADDAFYEAYLDVGENDAAFQSLQRRIIRIGTALWSALIALFIGLFLGIGEGVYYGSKEKAVIYALIGSGISIAIGYISGYIAQWMYATLLPDDPPGFLAAFIRGLGWALMGLGIGAAIGLIKPQIKRILFCVLGGLVGAFIGGFLFNYVTLIIPNDIAARCIAIIIMGLLIGVGVGLLEQFAKQAWLKVVRGEFEGKEYLVFSGTTSIGNNGKNTIVLFKDKLVGPNHCDIVLEGSRYTLIDKGTPMGTVVNGMRIQRHVLKKGDAIAIGNSVLVFNTK